MQSSAYTINRRTNGACAIAAVLILMATAFCVVVYAQESNAESDYTKVAEISTNFMSTSMDTEIAGTTFNTYETPSASSDNESAYCDGCEITVDSSNSYNSIDIPPSLVDILTCELVEMLSENIELKIYVDLGVIFSFDIICNSISTDILLNILDIEIAVLVEVIFFIIGYKCGNLPGGITGAMVGAAINAIVCKAISALIRSGCNLDNGFGVNVKDYREYNILGVHVQLPCEPKAEAFAL